MDSRIKGWNVSSIAERQKEKWPAYVESLKGARPLGISHEGTMGAQSVDWEDHNVLITYAYVLALAAHNRRRLTLLDWGGGIGHYFALSQALLPDVDIDYYCQDLPLLCSAGREVLPQAHFFEEPDACFIRSYDLVLASSSLWYEEQWRTLVDKLIGATVEYLYLTRMMFVSRAESFVAVQRPGAMGYQTEYLCWVFNRNEFVDYLVAHGMELVREFIIGRGSYIHRAPEQGDLRGFLFRKQISAGGNS